MSQKMPIFPKKALKMSGWQHCSQGVRLSPLSTFPVWPLPRSDWLNAPNQRHSRSTKAKRKRSLKAQKGETFTKSGKKPGGKKGPRTRTIHPPGQRERETRRRAPPGREWHTKVSGGTRTTTEGTTNSRPTEARPSSATRQHSAQGIDPDGPGLDPGQGSLGGGGEEPGSLFVPPSFREGLSRAALRIPLGICDRREHPSTPHSRLTRRLQSNLARRPRRPLSSAI